MLDSQAPIDFLEIEPGPPCVLKLSREAALVIGEALRLRMVDGPIEIVLSNEKGNLDARLD